MPPSHHNAAQSHINNKLGQETSPCHLHPNLTGAPPHTTAYLPSHWPDGSAVSTKVDHGPHKTVAADLSPTTYSRTPANPTIIPVTVAVGANTAASAPSDTIYTTPDTKIAYNEKITQSSTQTSSTRSTPPSTTNTPAHPLTSPSLSLLRSTTASYEPLEYFVSASSTDEPWNAVAYRTRHRRD